MQDKYKGSQYSLGSRMCLFAEYWSELELLNMQGRPQLNAFVDLRV